MKRRSKRQARRRRIGRVTLYQHHGGWWAYYREAGAAVRKRLAAEEGEAERLAAQVNAQLTAAAPTLFAFTPTPVGHLQREFLDHHEYVLRSSLATVNRYRTATQHLVKFVEEQAKPPAAHEIHAEAFVRYLRTARVSPNGHSHTPRRLLRDKGVRFILETCRSMYAFAGRQRRLPPYADNPFAGLGGKRIRIEDAKPVFVFDEQQELAFLKAACDWAFPIHFLLAKTGLRQGELVHLLIEDVDLDGGWLHVRNRPELGWLVKTRRERRVPLITEVADVLWRVIGDRRAGVLFLRPRATADSPPLLDCSGKELTRAAARRLAAAEAAGQQTSSRAHVAKIHTSVWRDAGALRVDQVRLSFVRIARQCELDDATCPKSWRHTFATLLQEGEVDPLVRQLTLGHSPTLGPESALGMTAVYTHTRPETQRRQVERALRRWPFSLELAYGRATKAQ